MKQKTLFYRLAAFLLAFTLLFGLMPLSGLKVKAENNISDDLFEITFNITESCPINDSTHKKKIYITDNTELNDQGLLNIVSFASDNKYLNQDLYISVKDSDEKKTDGITPKYPTFSTASLNTTNGEPYVLGQLIAGKARILDSSKNKYYIYLRGDLVEGETSKYYLKKVGFININLVNYNGSIQHTDFDMLPTNIPNKEDIITPNIYVPIEEEIMNHVYTSGVTIDNFHENMENDKAETPYNYTECSIQYNSKSSIYNAFNDSEKASAPGAHYFGYDTDGIKQESKDEKIRVTYSGCSYDNLTATYNFFNIPVDLNLYIRPEIRTLTQLSLKNGSHPIYVTYPDTITTEQIFNQIQLTYQDGEHQGEVISDVTMANFNIILPKEFNFEFSELKKAQTATVIFNGTDNYGPAAPVTVPFYVIPSLNATVSIKDLNITDTDLAALSDDEWMKVTNLENDDIDHLRIIAGIDGEATGFLSIDIPDSYKNQLVYTILQSIFNKIVEYTDEDGNTKTKNVPSDLTLKELNEKLIPYKQALSSGFEVLLKFLNVTQDKKQIEQYKQYLDLILTATDTISKIPVIQDSVISLGEKPTKSGVYKVFLTTADRNYIVRMDTATLTVTQSENPNPIRTFLKNFSVKLITFVKAMIHFKDYLPKADVI